MSFYHTEGIILHTLKFLDHDSIMTVFTRDFGLIKFFVKKGLKNHPISPLTQAELIFSQGKSNLFKCKEISVLNFHLKLRNNQETLQAAYNLILAIKNSQLEQQPAPLLYELLACYLQALPLFPNPCILAVSFQLKLLRHEGLLNISSFCSNHPTLSEEETRCFKQLALSRSLQELRSLTISPNLNEKLKSLCTP